MPATSPRPDGSRRQRKKERTRRDIYEAAMRLFARGGFEAATLSDICEEADVGRGTFFLHFPSKAALLYEFNQRIAEEFRATLDEPRGSARDELRALVDFISSALASQAEVMTAMLAEFFARPPGVDAASEQGTAMPDLIAEIVERGQERGEFGRGVAPQLAAASLLGTAAAILSGHVFRPGAVTAQEARRQLLQLVFTGLAPTGDAAGAGASRRRGRVQKSK